MDNIVLYDILVGSASKALNKAKYTGKLDFYDLHLLTLFGKLLNDFNSTLTLYQRNDLEEAIRLLRNKNSYICNYKYSAGSTITNSIINTKPTVTNAVITVPNLTYNFKESDYSSVFTDVDGDLPNLIRINSLPTEGTLTYNGNPVEANDEILLSNISNLLYTWTDYTDNSDGFNFQISDNNINNPLFSDMATTTINVTASVNLPPSQVGALTVNIDSQSIYTFTVANFTTETTPVYLDPEGDAALSVRIDTLPTSGTLLLDGELIEETGFDVLISEIQSGNFIYTSNPTDTSGYSETFNFSMSDTGSGSFTTGGQMTMTVAAYVNQAPTTGDSTVEVAEGAILTLTRAMFTTATTPPYSDTEGDQPVTLIIDSLPSTGTLKLNNINVTINQNIAFTDIDSGLFTYTQASNAGGTGVSFNWRIIDSAGSTSS